MKKVPLYTMIGSGVIILISMIMISIGFADILEIDVENEAIFQGTSGYVSVDEYGTYTIFVNDYYKCDEITISITDGTNEFFTLDCDSALDEDGWRAIGVMETDSNRELSVTSNHEIIIVDDITYAEEGGLMMIGGGGLCCFGLIGLVVGIIMASNQKGKTGVNHFVIQQPIIQQQEYQQTIQQLDQQPPIGP